MANLAACFCFGTLIFGIYGHQIDFKISGNAWEPALRNSPDDFSTEQQMANSENTLSTEENLSSTSSEYPVTLDPHPSVRPLSNKIYFSIRKGFSRIAKYDNNSKHIFDFFNRPNQSRGYIDLVFYSLEKSRKEVRDHASVLDETSPSKEHARTVDEPSAPEQDTTKYDEILGDDIPSVTSETMTRKPLEEVGLHLNKKLGALRRSGEILEVKDFVTQIAHSRDDTTKEAEEVYSTVENSEHDALPSSSTYGTPSEVPEDSDVYPEAESNHFTKDWSRTRFPPVKAKIVVNANIDEFAEQQNPYVSVQKLHKSKSVLTKEQADYIASQAVEGALGLAETIARETSQLVNRIITGALRQNAKSKTDKYVSSGTEFQN